MYVMGVWKIVFLWVKSCLGNYKIVVCSGIFSIDIYFNGSWRTDIHSISDSDRSWNCVLDHFKGVTHRGVYTKEEGGCVIWMLE